MTNLAEIRDENGKLPAFAWPGGYPLLYLDGENNTLCPDCANKEGYSSPVVAVDVYYEGPTLHCDDCSAAIESAYGDPWEEK